MLRRYEKFLSLLVAKTKVVKCGYAAKEKFEVKIIVLSVGCILINNVHW